MTDTNKNVTDLISPILQILWHVKKTKRSSLTTCTCLLWIVDKGLQGGSFQQRQRQRVTEAVKISETYCCSRRFHRFEPPPLGKVNFICQYDIINAFMLFFLPLDTCNLTPPKEYSACSSNFKYVYLLILIKYFRSDGQFGLSISIYLFYCHSYFHLIK